MSKTDVSVKKTDSIAPEVSERDRKVRDRAYELFQAHAGSLMAELDDWLAAEREVAPQPEVLMREVDGRYEIEAALPGVERRNLEVTASPGDVLITGVREGEHPATLFRAIHLPHAIDAGHVTAEYRQGLLHVSAPLLPDAPARSIEIRG